LRLLLLRFFKNWQAEKRSVPPAVSQQPRTVCAVLTEFIALSSEREFFNMYQKFSELRRRIDRRGQGLVEYGILVGGVALVCLAAVSLLGHQVNDMLSVVAGVLPGAHADDNAPIVSGKIVATTANADGNLVLDVSSPGTMSGNLGVTGVDSLVVEAE
jgi:Flp pilus assembly pilin Flp